MRRIGGMSGGLDGGSALHGRMINDTAAHLPDGCRAASIASGIAGTVPGNRENRNRLRAAAVRAVPGVSA